VSSPECSTPRCCSVSCKVACRVGFPRGGIHAIWEASRRGIRCVRASAISGIGQSSPSLRSACSTREDAAPASGAASRSGSRRRPRADLWIERDSAAETSYRRAAALPGTQSGRPALRGDRSRRRAITPCRPTARSLCAEGRHAIAATPRRPGGIAFIPGLPPSARSESRGSSGGGYAADADAALVLSPKRTRRRPGR
jgi:hypothetical protein